MSKVCTSILSYRSLWSISCAYSKSKQDYYYLSTRSQKISTSVQLNGEIKDSEKLLNKSTINVNSKTIEVEDKSSKLKQTSKLAKIFAEYGTTAVIFHTTISLTSLGISYTAVSSGIDVVALLQKLNLITEVSTEAKIASGASTFVIAYACHKVFMPLRIFLTATCTPFIVKKLRSVGILKTPINKSSS